MGISDFGHSVLTFEPNESPLGSIQFGTIPGDYVRPYSQGGYNLDIICQNFSKTDSEEKLKTQMHDSSSIAFPRPSSDVRTT